MEGKKGINIPQFILILAGMVFLATSLPLVPVECSGDNAVSYAEFVPPLLWEQACTTPSIGIHSSGYAWIKLVTPVFVLAGLLLLVWAGYRMKTEDETNNHD